MSIKSKFRDIKGRLADRHMFSIIAFAFVGVIAIAAYQAKVSSDYKNQLESQYRRSFNDLVQYVNGIETNLAKGVVVTEPKSVIRLADQIYTQASFATSNLGQLPLTGTNLDQMSKFLAQVGDFTQSLSFKFLDTNTMSDEDRNTMLSLSRYASSLKDSLNTMQNDLYSGKFSFKNPKQGGIVMAEGMSRIENQFQDYPSLIYDGPFSDHILETESTILKDAKELTPEEALKRMYEIFGKKHEIKQIGECNCKLATYTFEYRPDEKDKDRTVAVNLTKKGGLVADIIDSKQSGEAKISMDDALKRASDFLNKFSYHSMKNSYYEISDSTVTINYAYEQNGVIMYPDLIKVKVALDTGEIVGLEANGFLMNHKDRTLSQNLISEEECRSKVSSHAEIQTIRRCVIPLESLREVYCYEIKCKVNEKTFLIYLNAETGHEEDILILIESKNGSLTI